MLGLGRREARAGALRIGPLRPSLEPEGKTAVPSRWQATGRLRGKQPKLSPKQEAHLVELYRVGEHTIGELEELFPVTRSTIYRAVARADAHTPPPTKGKPKPIRSRRGTAS